MGQSIKNGPSKYFTWSILEYLDPNKSLSCSCLNCFGERQGEM